MVDLDLGSVQLDDQEPLGIERIARADIGLGALHGIPVHHFHAAGNDAGGNDGRDAVGSPCFGGKAQQHGPRRRRLAQQAYRHLGDDAQQAFRAGHQAHQVVAAGIEMLAPQPHDLAGHQHHLDAQQVVGGEAVFQAVHAAGILRDIAADRAGDLRTGIRCVVEALVLDRLGDAEVGDARLHTGAAIGVVDLEHAVELAQPQQDRIAHRHGAAGQRRAGAAGHHLDLVVLAVAQNGGDLRDRVGQDDDQRHLPIGRQRVALVGTHAVEIVDHALARHDGAQCRHDLGTARENGGVERRHLHASLLRQMKKRRKPKASAAFFIKTLTSRQTASQPWRALKRGLVLLIT